MGIELLNLDKPIKFVPKNQPKSSRPFTIYIRPLEWMDMMDGQDLYQQRGVDKDDNPIVNINTGDRELWYEFISKRITKITNEGISLPVSTDTIRRLPPLVGLELMTKVFTLMQGVKPKQAKK